MDEARLHETGGGLVPVTPGWFVVNARDTWWGVGGHFGHTAEFAEFDTPFEQLGIRLVVLEPGQPNALYHRESRQEGFLVVHGDCMLIVEDEERPLKTWDFFHCPADTAHILVGAGDGPCVVVTVGARAGGNDLLYPVSELALEYRAGVEHETDSPDEAYGPFIDDPRLERPPSWDELPWAK